MKRIAWTVVLVVVPLLQACELPFTFVAACSTNADCDVGKVCLGNACQEPLCDAGRQSQCLCPSGGMGTQTCNLERTGFTPCECPGTSSSSSSSSSANSTSSSSSGGSGGSNAGSSSVGGGSSGAAGSSSSRTGSSSVGNSSAGVSSGSSVGGSSSADGSSSLGNSSSVDPGSSSSGEPTVTLSFNVVGADAALVASVVLLDGTTGMSSTHPCGGNVCTVTQTAGKQMLAGANIPQKAGAIVSHWDQTMGVDDCALNANLCLVHFDDGNVVTIHVASVNYVFVLDGNAVTLPLNQGLADATCGTAATNAGLPSQNYRALLGFNGRSPRDVLNTGVVNNLARPDGFPVVAQAALLGAAGPFALYPPSINANGLPVAFTSISTGADLAGNTDPGFNCNNWQGGTGLGHATGMVDLNGRLWLETQYNDACLVGSPIQYLCTGTLTDLDGSFPNARVVRGKQVFVSSTPFLPSSGIAAADNICQQDAMDVGLGGTFRAILGTSTETAELRVNFMQQLTSTPNGVTAFFNRMGATTLADLIAPIALQANGQPPVDPLVITGGLPTSLPPSYHSCNDWMDSNGTMRIGYSGSVSLGFVTAAGNPSSCMESHPVYCMEVTP